jgi:hypothetical protein
MKQRLLGAVRGIQPWKIYTGGHESRKMLVGKRKEKGI